MLVNGINLTSSFKTKTFFENKQGEKEINCAMRRESIKLVCVEKKGFLLCNSSNFLETKSIKFDIQMEVGHYKSNYRALHRWENLVSKWFFKWCVRLSLFLNLLVTLGIRLVGDLRLWKRGFRWFQEFWEFSRIYNSFNEIKSSDDWKNSSLNRLFNSKPLHLSNFKCISLQKSPPINPPVYLINFFEITPQRPFKARSINLTTSI